MTLADYCKDKQFASRFDAKLDPPRKDRYVLISGHFFYFGCDAVPIPARFRNYPLEKRGPGFRYKNFTEDFISDFVSWLESNFEPGMNGEPCKPDPDFLKLKCPSKVRRKECAR